MHGHPAHGHALCAIIGTLLLYHCITDNIADHHGGSHWAAVDALRAESVFAVSVTTLTLPALADLTIDVRSLHMTTSPYVVIVFSNTVQIAWVVAVCIATCAYAPYAVM